MKIISWAPYSEKKVTYFGAKYIPKIVGNPIDYFSYIMVRQQTLPKIED